MINSRLAKAGLTKQTGKGAYTAAATYGYGLRGGRVVGAEINQEDEEVTSDNRMNAGANRLAVIPGMQYTVRAYPRLVGLLYYGALGSIATVGAAAPYTHTITPADDLPYLLPFGRQGAEYYRLKDAKIDSLSLKWDGPGPVDLDATFIGLDLEYLAGAFAVTNEEADSGGKFRGAGGTFKLDIDSAVPVTAPVSAGQIGIENDLEAVMLADSIRPNDVFPNIINSPVSLTLKPTDLLRWREIVTGTAAGAAISDVPIYGSYEVKFVIDANTDLIIAASRVPFLADFPEVNPGGGRQALVVRGKAMKPAGVGLTVTLRNAQASY